MSDLADILATGSRDRDLLLVLGIWALACLAAALPRPQVFLPDVEGAMVSERTRAYAWFYQRLASASVFATATWVGLQLRGGAASTYGFAWGRFDRTLIFVALASVVGLSMVAARSRQSDFKDHHPEIRIRRWTGRMLSNNRTTWLLYVAGYESLFRGFCLFALVDVLSPAAAIAVTTTFEVASHARRPGLEALIGLPMGVVLGIGALWTGSVLGPWVVHSLLILAAETIGRPHPPAHFET